MLLYILNPVVLQLLLIFMTKHKNRVFSGLFRMQLPTRESCIYLEAITPVWTDTSTTSGNSVLVSLEKALMSCHKVTRERPAMTMFYLLLQLQSNSPTIHFTLIIFILRKYLYQDLKIEYDIKASTSGVKPNLWRF